MLATIVVRADSEIQSIQDLKGHAIALGLAGSGAEFEERFLLEALGITYDDFTQVSQIGIGPGFTDFQDGKVDAVFAMMGPGNSNLMEAMTNVDVRILPLSADDIQTITQNCQWAAEDVIPGGSYMGIDEDIPTISVPTLLMVSDQVPEEAVYQMTEMVYDNIDSLIASNKNFGQWTFGISCGGNIPLHPGAEAFYEDRGLE